jgi:hypothetical protein
VVILNLELLILQVELFTPLSVCGIFKPRGAIMDIQLIIAIGTLAVSAGIAWGVAGGKLKILEIKLAIVEGEHKTDHDLLIHLDEKVSLILQKIEKIESKMYAWRITRI